MQVDYQDEITVKIIAILDRQASEADILFLREWMAQSEEQRLYFNRIKNIYEMSGMKINSATIRTDKALQKIFRKTEQGRTPFRVGVWLQKVAAVLFVPLLAASLYGWLRDSQDIATVPVNYIEMQTTAGLRSSVVLPDSTKVWLNSSSKIRYPDRFTGNERIVYMEGEAYFEVTSSIEHPFVVNTPFVQVRATGTKFNITDFENRQDKEITLVSGQVSVSWQQAQGTASVQLKPEQHFVYNVFNQSQQMMEGDIYKYYAWKDNKMVFRNDPMIDVVKRISQLYGVEIELKGNALKDYRYRATFEGESLYEILKLLKMSAPIDYREIKRKQEKDGSFSTPKIVIYPVSQPK